MPWLAPTLLVIGLAMSLPLTRVAIAWGRRVGALDSPGAPGHEKALRDVPNTGGIGIVFAWVIPVAAALAWLQFGGALPEGWERARVRAGMPATWATVAADRGMTELYPSNAVANSVMTPLFTAWWLRPVRSAARVGEQRAVVWKRL